jgi:hypothetical protein
VIWETDAVAMGLPKAWRNLCGPTRGAVRRAARAVRRTLQVRGR